MKKLYAILFVASAAVVSNASLFDFENMTAGVDTTSASQTVDGITMTLSRDSGSVFDFEDIAWAVSGIGNRTLSPFSTSGTLTVDDWFVVNFSQAVNSASIVFGDAGADDDTVTQLEAYSGLNGTGSLVDSDSNPWGTRNLFSVPLDSMSVSGGGIQSLRFRGGSDQFPQTLYWDNLRVTSVPEPMSMVVLGGAALLAARRRKR